MKFVIVGLFAIFFIYQFSTTEAAGVGLREKRSLAREMCPTGSTEQECFKYANEQLVKNKSCATFVLHSKTIEWQSCGSVLCTVGGKEVPKTQDLSKPYPDCCPKCDFSNVKVPENAEITETGTGK